MSKVAGFQPVLTAALAGKVDRQKFPAARAVNGRWVRLTIINNHGHASYTELLGFRGYGAMPPRRRIADISGTFDSITRSSTCASRERRSWAATSSKQGLLTAPSRDV